MSYIKDITLGEFSNLSYIDLPPKLIEDLKKGKQIQLKDLADISIDDYLAEEKSGEISYKDQDILNVLRKCQSGEYKDYKIVDYYNDNGKSGFVGMPLKLKQES